MNLKSINEMLNTEYLPAKGEVPYVPLRDYANTGETTSAEKIIPVAAAEDEADHAEWVYAQLRPMIAALRPRHSFQVMTTSRDFTIAVRRKNLKSLMALHSVLSPNNHPPGPLRLTMSLAPSLCGWEGVFFLEVRHMGSGTDRSAILTQIGLLTNQILEAMR